jgi:hypothetical protein
MANLSACKRAGFRVQVSKRAVQWGRPYAHAITGHNLILRDVSPPIAEAPPSRARGVRGAVRATSNTHRAPMQTEQHQPGRVRQRQESPKASRSPSPSPRIAEHHRPLRRSARAEFMREAREIRRGPQKSGSRHKPPPARRDAQKCEKLQKVPRRRGAARKDKLLESPVFLCGSVVFHLAAGQPCFMGWQNRETGRLGIEPEET